MRPSSALLAALAAAVSVASCLAAAPDAVTLAVNRTYIHGITEETARRELPPGAAPALLALLDEEGCARRDNVVAFLAYAGGPEATPRLLAFLERTRAVERARRTPEDDRAYLLAPQALGLIAGRGDDAALAALLALARDARAQGDLRGAALRGLGWSGRADARRALDAFARGAAPAAGALRRAAAQALALHRDVRGGLPGAAPEGVPFDPPRAGRGAGTTSRTSPPPPGPPPGPAPLVPDPATVAHEHGLSYANHVDVGEYERMRDDGLDNLMREASRVVTTAEFDVDVACCVRLARSGAGTTFGSASDGFAEIDDSVELYEVLDDRVARVKVVRAINWCGGPGLNIIGCSYLNGNGVAVVRYSWDEGVLWLHEYGHNLGLPHVPDGRYVMYAYASGSNVGLYANECAAFHQPPTVAAARVTEAGTCGDTDADGYLDLVDNCPTLPNWQGDYDADGVGDDCDNCRWVTNADQADPDGDALGSVCDNCPAASNAGQGDGDYDGIGDACDACPQEKPNDADGDGLCWPQDVCRWERDADQADADADGVGDRCDLCPADRVNDADMDGLCAERDNCPMTSNAPPWSRLSATAGGYGRSVAGVGDVDGDGYDDLLVGIPGYDLPSSSSPYDDRGAAFLYRGSPEGYSIDPAWAQFGSAAGQQFGNVVAAAGDVNGDHHKDLLVASVAPDGLVQLFYGTGTGVHAEAGWSARRAGTDDRFGAALAAGDVNADGLADVLVAAPSWGGGAPRVYVYLGRPEGPRTEPDEVLQPPDTSWSGFGAAVAVVGDMDGDGYGEAAVGAPSLQPRAGVFVWFGSPTGLLGAPVLLRADRAESQFGYALAAAGDVNGDGRADLLVGAPQRSRAPQGTYSAPSEEGGAYVYFGASPRPVVTVGGTAGSTGRGRAAERRRGSTAARIPVTPGWSYGHVGSMYRRFGQSVAAAGDLDGDGYGDLVIGARYGEGAYVFLGSRSGPGAWPAWHGRLGNSWLGALVAAAGDADGDGHPDIVVGNGPDLWGSGDLFAYRGGPGGIVAPQPDGDGDGVGDACDATP